MGDRDEKSQLRVQEKKLEKLRLEKEESQRAFNELLLRIRQNDPSLELVDCSFLGESVGSEMAARLAESLLGNDSVTTVDLTGNSVGDRGTERIARSLMRCRSITTLNLGGNAITVIGASFLAKALATNVTLRVLDLSFNHIETAGAEHLASAIASNRVSSLSCCDLRGNHIDERVVGRLQNMVKSNAAAPPRLFTSMLQQAQSLRDDIPDRPQQAPPAPPAYVGNVSILFDSSRPAPKCTVPAPPIIVRHAALQRPGYREADIALW